MDGYRPKGDQPFDPATVIPPPSGTGVQSPPQQRLEELQRVLEEMQRYRLPTTSVMDNGNRVMVYSLPETVYARLMLVLPQVESVHKRRPLQREIRKL